MIERPRALLYMSYAYGYTSDPPPWRGVPPGDLAANSEGLLRPLDHRESKEFSETDMGVLHELNKPPFALERSRWRDDIEVQFPKQHPFAGTVDTKLLVSVGSNSADLNVVFLSLSVTFDEQPETDRLVALLQSHLQDGGPSGGLAVMSAGITHSSCKQFIQSCAAHLHIPDCKSVPFWITEFRTGQARTMRASADPALARQGYGVLTTDEGWRDVPEDHAIQVLKTQWTSRDFFTACASGNGVVVYNDKDHLYGRRATTFFDGWFSTPKPYYSTIFHVAGLDHGVLYSIEAAIQLRLAAEQLTEAAVHALGNGQARSLLTSLKVSWGELIHPRVSSMQLSVLRFLELVRYVDVGELRNLDQMIAEQVGLTARRQEVARVSEVIDTQSMNLAATRLNTLVAALTLLATLAAFVALLK
jgi:hypothetical protein